MRKFCHLLCLGLNLAWGTSVAAAPVAPAPYKLSEWTAVAQTGLAAGKPTASSFKPAACQKSHVGLAGFNFITGRPTEIDSGLHMIRFVDRYWPAKMGFEPPAKVSTLCFCAPDSIHEGPGEKGFTLAPV